VPRWSRQHAPAFWILASCGRISFDGISEDARDDSLVAWYSMESDPTTFVSPDVTGHGNDARCSGSACPIRVTGVRGYAFEFDGVDDRFEVPDSPMLRLSDGFTVTLWVQWFGGDAAVISKPQATGTGASFEISILPQLILACTDDTLGAEGEQCFDRLGPLPLATWTALALTWDGGLRTLYLDGAQIASSQHGTVFDDSPLVIGGDNHDGAPSSQHHGLVDEVQIYRRALAPGEIAALHTLER
jgi:hypothetical protein